MSIDLNRKEDNMKTIWLVNPYGPIEGENWREYSFNQFGKYLSQNGYRVIWWTANFSHHFKKYRSKSWKDIKVNKNFIIRLVPTNSYKKNISLGRFRKDYLFGKNALRGFRKSKKPDLIIAYENPMCMGKPAFEFAYKKRIPLIYDQMDIWPEFLVKVIPKPLSYVVNLLLEPVYLKRKKIYNCLDGSIALGKHYLEFMFHINPSLQDKPNALVYNGIDVDSFRSHLNDLVTCDKIPTNKDKNEIWCIFAGTLGPSYDIQSIIECAKRFEKDGIKEFKFIIAGSGPLEEVVINAEKELNNVIYVGKLLPEQLIPIYGKCDIGLQTYSAGSNVDMCDKFYDYTAAGLAVVNSLTGEVSEHIIESKLGENYLAGDYDEFQNAILKFKDKDYLSSAKEKSLQIGSEFDMKNQNEKLLAVISKII